MRTTILTWLRAVLMGLLLVLGGCGGHDISSVKSALLGHWVTESGETHYYFNTASLVMLDDGRRMDQTYAVLELNEAGNWIKIRVKTGYEMGHDKHLVFSPDRKSLTQKIELEEFGKNVIISTRWNYVDLKKLP